MATVKISELPEIYHLSTNTEATLVVGVNLDTGTTGKINVATLGEGLYAYQPLKVGENQVLFANTIGQFSGNSNTFLQINNQNFNSNGSSDYAAHASDSDNSNKYIDMGINGSTFNDPTYTSMRPYDGYLYTYGPSALSASGNLVIGTASSFANIVFIVGGTVTNNIVARMTKTDLQLSAGYNIKFGDGSIQSVAASPVNYSQAAFTLANNTSVLSQAAFNVANTSSANTFITQGVDLSQNVRIDYSNTALTITQGVDVSQNVRLDFSNTRITINDGVNDTQNSRIGVVESINFSQNARMTIIEGTDVTQNTAILATDSKMQSAYSTANNAFSKANNALANTSGIFAGDLTVTGNVNPQKGFIFNSLQYNSPETAITIDFANNSLVQCNTSTGLVVSLTNHIPGKVVDLWVTNISGTGRTFTHGCNAQKSTVGSTTYTISSGHSILAKYYSFDNSISNTFVAIIN